VTTASSTVRPLSFNAPVARVPGEETPLFFGILRGRAGQQPLVTIVNHVDQPFSMPDGTKSHKVTLSIPTSVGLAALGEEVSRVANHIRSTHEAFRDPKVKEAFEAKGQKWQDWNSKAREAVMTEITKVLTDFGIVNLANVQLAYRPRGVSATPDGTPTTGLASPVSSFDPDNI